MGGNEGADEGDVPWLSVYSFTPSSTCLHLKRPMEPATSSPLLLTPAEAARRLSLAESTVYQLLARGELESINIGRARRIPLDALVSYVDRLRREQQG